MKMPKLPDGVTLSTWCAACGRRVDVTKRGTIAQHRTLSWPGGGPQCVGRARALTPAELRAAITTALGAADQEAIHCAERAVDARRAAEEYDRMGAEARARRSALADIIIKLTEETTR